MQSQNGGKITGFSFKTKRFSNPETSQMSIMNNNNDYDEGDSRDI